MLDKSYMSYMAKLYNFYVCEGSQSSKSTKPFYSTNSNLYNKIFMLAEHSKVTFALQQFTVTCVQKDRLTLV